MTESANVLNSLWETVQKSGVMGLAIVVLTPLLLAACILIAALARSRGPWVVLWVLAVLPLGIGLIGTAAGYAEIQEHQRLLGEMADPYVTAHWQALAWHPTYFGAGATSLLSLVGVVGWGLRRAPRDARSAARLDMAAFPSDGPGPPAPSP